MDQSSRGLFSIISRQCICRGVFHSVHDFVTQIKAFIRQNGAPSGLEKRGFDASIYHKTRKPTEGTQ
ncbi:hypothetical protein IQA64_09025 [Leptospira borgpetersenii serovar Tarassovi]|nr:hypothetical protein [Leptospira borgpetersenii serovar Tarassovi]